MIKFNFKNLGPIKKGQLELNNFNVFCGGNNTGKTYLNYLVYTILNEIQGIEKREVITYKKNELNELEETIIIDFEKYIVTLIKTLEKNIKNKLPEVFAMEEEMFANFSISFNYDLEEIIKMIKESELSHKIGFVYSGVIVKILKPKNDFVIKINKENGIAVKDTKMNELNRVTDFFNSSYLDSLTSTDYDVKKERDSFIKRIISLAINRFVNRLIFNFSTAKEIFSLPAERSGLSIFYRNLVENRSNYLDEIVRNTNEDKFLNLVDKVVKYPKPINDYINFLNRIHVLEKRTKRSKTRINEIVNSIEENIVHGKYFYKENRMKFKNELNIDLDLHAVSSAVKTFSGFLYYLKYCARKGDWILIDEPELNLHPDNQRKLARILTYLINLDLRIVITTHSPYIIEEINNMIMLSRKIKKEEKEFLMKKFKINKEEIIAPEKVAAYCINKEQVEPMNKSEYGIAVDSFNEVINSLNEFSEELYFAEVE